MNAFLKSIEESLLMSFGMLWQVAWSLALGYTITSIIGIAVSADTIKKKFGKSGCREIALYIILTLSVKISGIAIQKWYKRFYPETGRAAGKRYPCSYKVSITYYQPFLLRCIGIYNNTSH